MKKCKNPWCNKEFTPIDNKQKYCSKECAAFIHERQKHGKIPDVVVYVKCENCGRDHDGSYGSGKFCSLSCARSFQAKQIHENGKLKKHLDSIHVNRRKNNWKCLICSNVFATRQELKQHMQIEHACKYSADNVCPYCGKDFQKKFSLMGHLSKCKKHPLKDQHDLACKQAGRTLKRRIAIGEVVPCWTGKTLPVEMRQKISDSRVKTLDSNLKCGRRLDVKWYKVKNLNGVEYTVRGHWEENVALELNRRGILWERNKSVKYQKDIIRNYVPDFYLPQFGNAFLEVKGYFPEEDYDKMKLALEYNPTMKLFLIGESVYKDFIDGKVDLQNCCFV